MKQNNLIKIGNGIANRINSIDIIVVNEKLIVDSIDKFIINLKQRYKIIIVCRENGFINKVDKRYYVAYLYERESWSIEYIRQREIKLIKIKFEL